MVEGEFMYPSLLTSSLSFWSGVPSVLDIGCVLYTYNFSDTPEDADRKVLSHDWRVVGEDIRQSMECYEQTKSKE